jgi:hypothetical protein
MAPGRQGQPSPSFTLDGEIGFAKEVIGVHACREHRAIRFVPLVTGQGPGKVMKLGCHLGCINGRVVPGGCGGGGGGPGGTVGALALTVVCREATPARSCRRRPWRLLPAAGALLICLPVPGLAEQTRAAALAGRAACRRRRGGDRGFRVVRRVGSAGRRCRGGRAGRVRSRPRAGGRLVIAVGGTAVRGARDREQKAPHRAAAVARGIGAVPGQVAATRGPMRSLPSGTG